MAVYHMAHSGSSKVSQFWTAWYALGGTREMGQQFLADRGGDFERAWQALQPQPEPQARPTLGRRLPDHVTRVDVKARNPRDPDAGVIMAWYAGNQHIEMREDLALTVDAAAASLEAMEGWTLRRWPGGCRAFRGRPYPIRSRGQIQRLRRELQAYPRPELQGKAWTLDLALDL